MQLFLDTILGKQKSPATQSPDLAIQRLDSHPDLEKNRASLQHINLETNRAPLQRAASQPNMEIYRANLHSPNWETKNSQRTQFQPYMEINRANLQPSHFGNGRGNLHDARNSPQIGKSATGLQTNYDSDRGPNISPHTAPHPLSSPSNTLFSSTFHLPTPPPHLLSSPRTHPSPPHFLSSPPHPLSSPPRPLSSSPSRPSPSSPHFYPAPSSPIPIHQNSTYRFPAQNLKPNSNFWSNFTDLSHSPVYQSISPSSNTFIPPSPPYNLSATSSSTPSTTSSNAYFGITPPRDPPFFSPSFPPYSSDTFSSSLYSISANLSASTLSSSPSLSPTSLSHTPHYPPPLSGSTEKQKGREDDKKRRKRDKEEELSSSAEIEQEKDVEDSAARDMVHKLSEKNRRDRLSMRYSKLQDLMQNVSSVLPVKRKGRNGDIRREDVLEMCEKFIVKATTKSAIANSVICKMAAIGDMGYFQWLTQTEIDTCYEAILDDLWRNYLGCDRPYNIFSRQLATLNFLDERCQVMHSRLFTLATNCITYTFIMFQPKEGLEIACLGWDEYTSAQPNYDKAPAKGLQPILYQGIDLGALFLAHKALFLAAIGKPSEAEREWLYFKEFASAFKCENGKMTNFLSKTLDIIFRKWQGEVHTREEYYQFMSEAAEMAPQAVKHVPRVLCGLGYVVSSTPSSPEFPTPSSMGISICERAVHEQIKYGGEFADLLICDLVVASYANAGMAKEGVHRADDFLKRFEMLGARGPGYAGVLKSKGDCLALLGNTDEAVEQYKEALEVAFLQNLHVLKMEVAIASSRIRPSENTTNILANWEKHTWSPSIKLKIQNALQFLM